MRLPIQAGYILMHVEDIACMSREALIWKIERKGISTRFARALTETKRTDPLNRSDGLSGRQKKGQHKWHESRHRCIYDLRLGSSMSIHAFLKVID